MSCQNVVQKVVDEEAPSLSHTLRCSSSLTSQITKLILIDRLHGLVY